MGDMFDNFLMDSLNIKVDIYNMDIYPSMDDQTGIGHGKKRRYNPLKRG